VATAYLLAAAMFLLPFGKLADIYGQKRIFTYGIVVTILSAFCCTIAPSARWFIGFRVAQGIGAAMIAGTSIAILTSVFPSADRGKALGINVAATYFGLSLGPVLGGVLTQHFGWHSIFLVNVIAGVIILAGVFWKLS
jgi:MFS family permease